MQTNTTSTAAQAVPKGGGLPAPIEGQLVTIEREVRRSRSLGHPTDKLVEDLNRFAASIPCSARTRRLQDQARDVFLKRQETVSPVEAAQLDEQLGAYLDQINQDSDYTSVLQTLQQRTASPVGGQTVPTKPLPRISVNSGSKLFASTASTSMNSYPWNKLQPGDILLWDARDGKKGILESLMFALDFSHAALYLGNGKTYEASSPEEGVREFDLSGRWGKQGMRVAIGRVKSRSSSQNQTASVWARSQFGNNGQTKYHWLPPWDKDYLRNGLYCSQLVWVAYNNANIDLDSNDWKYLAWFAAVHFYIRDAVWVAWYAVFPDELRRSDKIDWWYDDRNR